PGFFQGKPQGRIVLNFARSQILRPQGKGKQQKKKISQNEEAGIVFFHPSINIHTPVSHLSARDGK
ncbi:MAG: hypothetical protein LBT95_03515, partial [Treponema sp.]|nr:hypothetical protein [Treponema sp.]